jgi:hypothetical protein
MKYAETWLFEYAQFEMSLILTMPLRAGVPVKAAAKARPANRTIRRSIVRILGPAATVTSFDIELKLVR